jgi:hypothetical protein
MYFREPGLTNNIMKSIAGWGWTLKPELAPYLRTGFAAAAAWN